MITTKTLMTTNKIFTEQDAIYREIENSIPKYRDLLSVETKENGEAFVTLPTRLSEGAAFGAIGRYDRLDDMKATFPLVPVRSEVKAKLDRVDKMLKERDSSIQLVVAYGYRSMEVQKKYFAEQKAWHVQNRQGDEAEDIDEEVHRMSIAVPEVAGHPTGGAVDVMIVNKDTGEPLDFGTRIFTLGCKETYALSPFISDDAKKNRALLREVMFAENFAPYDGEWWHFSFGEREWAFYYKVPFAVYGQIGEREVAGSLAKQ
jgi:zinc D-Ala-D-Ala dipeptidase